MNLLVLNVILLQLEYTLKFLNIKNDSSQLFCKLPKEASKNNLENLNVKRCLPACISTLHIIKPSYLLFYLVYLF